MEGIGDGERETRRRGWPRDTRVLAGKPDTAGRSVSLFPRRVKGAGFYWGVQRGRQPALQWSGSFSPPELRAEG